MTFANDADTGAIQQFDFSVDLLKAILWQYDQAANVQDLLNAKADWYGTNQTAFWEDWLTNVFDLRTANDFGLSVWSVILQLPLYTNPPSDLGNVFGFDAQTGFNFDNGIFGDVNTYQLPTEAKRLALRLRYFQLTSSGTVPEVNRELASLFSGYGTAYLIDDHDMTQTYIFDFPVISDLKYLFNQFDILPRPAGVASQWIDATLNYFGFASGDFNFDNGVFGS